MFMTGADWTCAEWAGLELSVGKGSTWPTPCLLLLPTSMARSIGWVLPATPEGLERWLWGRTSCSVCLCIGSRCLLLEAAERTHSGLKPERAVWAQHLWKPEMRQFWTFEIFLDAWQATAAVGNFCWEKTLRVAAYAWALGKTKQAMQGRCEQFGSAEVYKNGPGLIPSACLCISDS